ncbi:rho guanine nucleotide exchange factor 3-like [Athalia rosae]|uniref:rho guanine nucleotide exchange factor 3-like n=1 Tax=Athalia rosae TaxID=37344 RepID=UPI002034697C|nr:rho guanine nucleotide exchange factor 3-like [Athalia rosae]
MDEHHDISIKDRLPEPQKRFWMRSRKRRNSDAASVNSMDISMGCESLKKKKRRRITEVATSLFTLSSSSSSSSTPNKFTSVLQRSFGSQISHADISLLGEETNTKTIEERLSKVNTERLDQLSIRSWIVDIAEGKCGGQLDKSLSRREIKRQEAIYELFCGEEVLLHDLNNLREIYYEPLLNANILTPGELSTLFGDISSLIDLHSRLRDELVDLRDASGFTKVVGTTLINWLPSLAECYIDRCKTQVWVRHLLDAKRVTNKRFEDFLKKKTSAPRSVDLWTYLDVPRSRVVKYPLLVNEILRHTSSNHSDQTLLRKASGILSKLLIEIDQGIGMSECQLAQSRINPSPVHDPNKSIEKAAELITEGLLRDARGTKLHCFLFDNCFVLTRPARRLGRKCNPCFPVITSGELKFQPDIGSNQKLYSNGFKIGEHTLSTEDEHSKRHWLESLRRIRNTNTDTDTDLYMSTKENMDETPNESGLLPSPNLKTNKKRKSLGDLCSRKIILRVKRSSIGLV